jgi:AGZA family xanthine/uracil permease-like MFS transporter
VLYARGVPGAALIGMVAATSVALALGLATFEGIVAMPPSLAPTFLELDVAGALSPGLIDAVFVFFFLALFDSIGTLVGLTSRIGLARDGTFPRARQALLADAVGTVIGAGLGTSTVTAYVESSSGVAAGGRTGLSSVVTAALFLVALFFYPLVKLVAGGHSTGAGPTLYPIIAPALIFVGVTMMESVTRVKWHDFTEAMPAFLAMITMPLAFSITDGIAFGLIAYAILKPATGRGRELHWLTYVFAGLLALRYAL